MKKKFGKMVLVALLGTVMTASFVGCGKGNSSETSESSDTVKIGYLQDLTGNYGSVGSSKAEGAKMAVEELNENGGINGKKVELVEYDSASDTSKAEEGAKQLYLQDEVDVIIGCYSSTSCELVRSVADEYNKIFFFDSVYEGGTFSHNFFNVSLSEDTQLSTLMKYMTDTFGKNVYVVYHDYVWGQISNEWVEYFTKEYGGNLVGTSAVPFDNTDYTDVITDIKKSNPDFVITEIAGDAGNAFFKQAESQELNIPMGSTVNLINGEHITLGQDVMANMYTTTSYSEVVDTEENKEFIKKWKEKFETSYISSDAFNAYLSVMEYATAVEDAGTTEVEAVIDSLEKGLVYKSVVGDVSIDPQNHTGFMPQYLIKCNADTGLELLDTFDAVKPFMAEKCEIDVSKMENKDEKTGKYSPSDMK